MKFNVGRALWPAICLVLLLAIVLESGKFPLPGVSAHDSCPPGEVPSPFVSLAAVPLPADVLPYSKMALARITLQPGKTLDVTPAGFTAYYVESGALKYKADRPGFAIHEVPTCQSLDGHNSSRGHFSIDAEGMALVQRGQALISDAIPTGPIANGGDVPLVMLQMSFIPPMIDPATGQPIPDSVVLARAAAREREQRKQACRAAADGAALATPTLVPIVPADDIN